MHTYTDYHAVTLADANFSPDYLLETARWYYSALAERAVGMQADVRLDVSGGQIILCLIFDS
jgi:hypothetical protein